MALKTASMADIQAAIAARTNQRAAPLPGWSQRVQTEALRNPANLDYAIHCGSERAQSGGLSDSPDDGGPKVGNGKRPFRLK